VNALSHIFFADDSLLFCWANFNEWGNVLNILHRYELASGQKLNSAKTSIFYSRNTRTTLKDFIRSLASIPVAASFEKYLGLLKAVVQAISTYCMSVFQLPKALCMPVHSFMNRFWWGSKSNSK
jgi:hypothetical protein